MKQAILEDLLDLITKWSKNRLGERSTKNGAAIILAALGIWFGPDQAEEIIAAIAVLYGAYEALRSEQAQGAGDS